MRYNAAMFRDVFRNALRNARTIYTGYNLAWHVFAIALTAGLVLSGFDWWFFTETREDFWHPFVYTAGIGGFFIPVLVPVCLHIYGVLRGDRRWARAGSAAIQAVILAWLITAVYKTFTGRIQPEFITFTSAIDSSRGFQFGFLRHGIFWGWPSSHTAVATAMAFALAPFLYRPGRFLAYTYAGFIALGAGIGFHWFSDVLAGGIVGAIVGSVVAASFLRSQ